MAVWTFLGRSVVKKRNNIGLRTPCGFLLSASFFGCILYSSELWLSCYPNTGRSTWTYSQIHCISGVSASPSIPCLRPSSHQFNRQASVRCVTGWTTQTYKCFIIYLSVEDSTLATRRFPSREMAQNTQRFRQNGSNDGQCPTTDSPSISYASADRREESIHQNSNWLSGSLKPLIMC